MFPCKESSYVVSRGGHPESRPTPHHSAAQGVARRQADPPEDLGQPDRNAPGDGRGDPPGGQGRRRVREAGRSVSGSSQLAAWPCLRGVGRLSATGSAAHSASRFLPRTRSGAGRHHPAGAGAGFEAGRRPPAVAVHGDLQPRGGAGAGRRIGQRDAVHARLAAEATGMDREEPRQPAPEGRHARALRRDLQLSGGSQVPIGRVRPQSGRQEGQEANRLWTPVLARRLPGGGGSVPRQRRGSDHRRRASREDPRPVRHRTGRACGGSRHAHHRADPGDGGARRPRLDLGAEDHRSPQVAEGNPARRNRLL